MNKRIFLSVFILIYAAQAARADHTGIGVGPGGAGPVNFVSASTLPANTLTAGVSTEFVKSKAFSDNELIGMAGNHIHAHSSDYVLTTAFNAAYGVTDNLTLSLRLPFIHRENIRAGAHSHVGGVAVNEVDDHGDSGGFGDITLTGQYKFLDAPVQSALLLGLRLPTGQTDARNNGETLEAEHQAGSGSWDPFFGFAVSKQVGPVSLDAGALYAFVTEGAQDANLGDKASYNLAVSHRVGGEKHDHGHGVIHTHESWDLALELNGEWYEKQETAGNVDDDSGGNQIFLGPGLRYTSDARWSAYVSAGVPVVNNLRRGHPDTDYKITAGIGRVF